MTLFTLPAQNLQCFLTITDAAVYFALQMNKGRCGSYFKNN